MKMTFQDSVNSVTLAECFLGLEAKRGGVKNCSRFFVQNGSLKVVQKWMNTTEAKDEFVYSAYKDGDTIRVLGATVIFRSAQPARFCKFWYKNVNKGDFSISVVRAMLTMIPEDHGTK